MGLIGQFGKKTLQELIDAGYPESVAARIASGELPMDNASRMARAAEQGYDLEPVYHGYTGRKLEDYFNTPLLNIEAPVYGSTDPMVASTYGSSFDRGAVIPMLFKKPDQTIDAQGNRWHDVFGHYNLYDDSIRQVDTDTLAQEAMDAGVGVLQFKDLVDLSETDYVQRHVFPDANLTNLASDIRVALDPTAAKSKLSAAFDPEYSGPNILGAGATLGTAGLLGAATLQSEDADASMVGLASKIGQASQDMLGMAKKMKSAGMSSDDIWKRTGWNEGVDGLWRTEHTNYDNTKLNLDKLNKDGSNTLTLEEAIDDPVLLSSYDGESPLMLGKLKNEGYASEPKKLKDYRIRFNPEMKEDGRFNAFSGVLEINPNQRQDQIREVILHELQHGIQGLEGFSDGANPERIKAVIRNPNASDQNVGYYNSLFGRKVPSNLSDDDAFKAYRRNAGEVEAEAVVYRDQLGRMYGDEYGYDPRERAPEEVEMLSGASSRELQNPFSFNDFSDKEMEAFGEYGGRFKRNEKNLATGLSLLGAAAGASADEGEQDSGESELDRIMRLTDEIERKDEMAKAFGSASLGDVALDLVGMGVESAAKEIAGLGTQALRSLYLGITGRPKDDQSVYSKMTSPDFMPESYSPEAQALVDNYINPAMEKAGNAFVENVIYPAAQTDLGQAAIGKAADAVEGYQGLSPRAQNFIDAGGAGLLALLSVGTGGRAKPSRVIPDKELLKLIGN